jgi:hypothetical protein
VTMYRFDAGSGSDLDRRGGGDVQSPAVPSGRLGAARAHPPPQRVPLDVRHLAGRVTRSPDSIAKDRGRLRRKVAPRQRVRPHRDDVGVIANSGQMYFAKKDSVGLPMPAPTCGSWTRTATTSIRRRGGAVGAGPEQRARLLEQAG